MRRTVVAFLMSLVLAAGGASAGDADGVHWSFRPRCRPTVPCPADAAGRAWVRTDVDAFVLAALSAHGLHPAPEADRRTLLRRVTFDLTGLPPTPAEVDAFVQDQRPDAWERVVDRLLAAPAYGERWGRHWLDVVRYAETEGFEYDRHRPGAWRYRDYVVRAFNEDRPYDRFLLEQLAGDELPDGGAEGRVAAGFHRLGPVRRNAGNALVAFSRNEVLTEQTDAVGAVFLGLTVGCCRCHDHKFDDLSQTDYYRLQAFLAPAHEHDIILADEPTRASWTAHTARVQAEIKALKKSLASLSGDARGRMEARLRAAERRLPPPLPTISSVHDDPQRRTTVHVLKRGDPERKGKAVAPGLPHALAPGQPDLPADARAPRLGLARWLNEPDHPLTARVLVNRVWQYHFGTGLVATPNDLGVNGARPSHPELLDHLANRFIAEGRRLKPLHRLILLGSTYRQAARSPAVTEGQRRDPDNRLLWRFPRRRLEAEEVRDAMLAVAGRLNRRADGPSVIVPAAADLVNLLYDPGQWAVTPDPGEHDRRSVYLFAKRNLRLPFAEAFDQPDLQTSCPRRESCTHPLQALELLNGRTSNRLAAALARRLRAEAGPDPARQVERAYRLAAGRPPTPREQALAVAFLRRQPLEAFALAVFNLNAFLYVE